MSRRPKPESETPQEEDERRLLETVSNGAGRSEKTAWHRKLGNMVKLLAQLAPIEDEILKLQADKMPIFDEVHTLRQTMVSDCVHPFEYLTLQPGTRVVLCKFCDRKVASI